jgi:hypothetical protein
MFNVLGQKVASPVNEIKGKGKYSVSFSSLGVQLDAGSYMLRMTVDGYSQTQLLQVVR